ncbi:hypothetical protein MYX64_12690, partial [Nitrospinae bacterium AH_259_B05_G02_I21]|nr:hypothetical protein [Nitrospinae bacterium AH_259_B05_G02_I21]
LRMVYGSGLLNGPFAFLFGYNRGLIGLNDRIKLRPLVCGVKGDVTIMASEESAIREIYPDLDKAWAPPGGGTRHRRARPRRRDLSALGGADRARGGRPIQRIGKRAQIW